MARCDGWRQRQSGGSARPCASFSSAQRTRPPDGGTLRVGYIGFDFRKHPMGFMTSGALLHHNRRRVHASCFHYGEMDWTGLLHHMELFVGDLERSVKLWGWLLEELGYKKMEEWDGGVSYRLGWVW